MTKLYHYSQAKFSTLLTREKQGKVTKEDEKKAHELYVNDCKLYKSLRPGYYYEHISFFFDRPPLDRISGCFEGKHEFWKKSNKVFEHVVESSDIHSFLYEIVESPGKTELYYKDISDATYYKQLSEMIVKLGLVGKNNQSLEDALVHFQGKTGEYFDLLKTRPNFQDLIKKYAATVPHLMIYPVTGTIKVNSVSQVTLG